MLKLPQADLLLRLCDTLQPPGEATDSRTKRRGAYTEACMLASAFAAEASAAAAADSAAAAANSAADAASSSSSLSASLSASSSSSDAPLSAEQRELHMSRLATGYWQFGEKFTQPRNAKCLRHVYVTYTTKSDLGPEEVSMVSYPTVVLFVERYFTNARKHRNLILAARKSAVAGPGASEIQTELRRKRMSAREMRKKRVRTITIHHISLCSNY